MTSKYLFTRNDLTGKELLFMWIEELPAGQTITLMAVIGSENIEFETTIQGPGDKKHSVLADVIKKNEKVLTFHAKGLIINLLASPPDSAPMFFRNVTVTLMKKQDQTLCYQILTLAEGKVYNRRESFRCYVGMESSIQCGHNRAAHEGIIRDVSLTGFSVACSNEYDFHENQVIHVLLNDYLEELAENFNFHLDGIIVRIEPLENDRVIYGCRLNTRVPGLDAYIMKKERLRLKKQGGN